MKSRDRHYLWASVEDLFQQETPVNSQRTIQKIQLTETLAAEEDMPKMLLL